LFLLLAREKGNQNKVNSLIINSNDRDKSILENTIIKQSFWLNKKFIQKLLNETN